HIAGNREPSPRQTRVPGVIRIFNVYYPIRTLILIIGEAVLVLASFLLVTVLQYREDSYLVLNFEHGYSRIAILTAFVVLLSYFFFRIGWTFTNSANRRPWGPGESFSSKRF